MDPKKPDNSDNLISEDSLDETGHEVVRISDNELAQKFINNNFQALNNPHAVFTDIDDLHDQKLEVGQEVQDINDELRQRTLDEIQENNLELKSLLEEDYRKKKILRYWTQVKLFFKNTAPQFYNDSNNVALTSNDWVDYQEVKVHRLRAADIRNKDFNTYFELMLRNKQKLSWIWRCEIVVSLFYLFFAVACLFVINYFNHAYGSNTTTITTNINQLYKAVISFSVSSIIFLIIPYFFLFTSWFVGINQVPKSKNFHLFMLLFLALTTILLLINLGLLISYFAYSWQLWIPS